VCVLFQHHTCRSRRASSNVLSVVDLASFSVHNLTVPCCGSFSVVNSAPAIVSSATFRQLHYVQYGARDMYRFIVVDMEAPSKPALNVSIPIPGWVNTSHSVDVFKCVVYNGKTLNDSHVYFALSDYTFMYVQRKACATSVFMLLVSRLPYLFSPSTNKLSMVGGGGSSSRRAATALTFLGGCVCGRASSCRPECRT